MHWVQTNINKLLLCSSLSPKRTANKMANELAWYPISSRARQKRQRRPGKGKNSNTDQLSQHVMAKHKSNKDVQFYLLRNTEVQHDLYKTYLSHFPDSHWLNKLRHIIDLGQIDTIKSSKGNPHEKLDFCALLIALMQAASLFIFI